jgi:hypothetical protein
MTFVFPLRINLSRQASHLQLPYLPSFKQTHAETQEKTNLRHAPSLASFAELHNRIEGT